MALVGLRTFGVGPGMHWNTWNTLEHPEIPCSKLSCNVGHFGFELVSHNSRLSLPHSGLLVLEEDVDMPVQGILSSLGR